ncbi:MAG: hypothetical protein FIB01_09490 [Gemmatimonadetes bacterium]|nr:hypothetical protein [Gemmatimonadota bacterium]
MTRRSCRSLLGRLLPLVLVAMLAAARSGAAQSPADGLGRTQWSYMHTLFQRTFLKVDVLTIDVCFDAPTAQRFATVAGRGPLTGAAADTITRAALAGARAQGRIEFLRTISLDEFLDGVAEDMQKAVKARVLGDSIYKAVVAGLPASYAFLEKRRIRKGDQLVYDMAGDTIRTRYIGADGTVLLDELAVARQRRNSPLATWFTPGSAYRSGLLQSLQRDGARAADEPLAARCRPRLR